jgi:plasmid stabilization system protein ParE
MPKFYLRKKAAQDILSAAEWYDDEYGGLGDEFADEVDRVFGYISQFPKMFPKSDFGMHKAPLRRFPYTVYYYFKNERISIITCLHDSRNKENIIEERN